MNIILLAATKNEMPTWLVMAIVVPCLVYTLVGFGLGLRLFTLPAARQALYFCVFPMHAVVFLLMALIGAGEKYEQSGEFTPREVLYVAIVLVFFFLLFLDL